MNQATNEIVVPSHADLTARCTALEAENAKEREFSRTVLASMHWTGDGYEWTGGQYDYRMQPHEAVAATVNELSRLRLADKERLAIQRQFYDLYRAAGLPEGGITIDMIHVFGELKKAREQAARYADATPVDEAWLIAGGEWRNNGDGNYRPKARMKVDVMWYAVTKRFYIQGYPVDSLTRGQLAKLLDGLRGEA